MEEPPNLIESLVLTYDKSLDDIRRLWDKVFDDPERFSDYYFNNICEDNKILSVYHNDQLIGMIHLNPYKLYYEGKLVDSYYVVGVAVVRRYRGKGIMKYMISQAIEDIKKEGIPFVFLMPKLEEYYLSSGFEKIYNTRQLEYTAVDYDEFDREVSDCYASLMLYTEHLSKIGDELFDKVADNINDNLSAKYDVFCYRDSDYLKTMIEEHKCQSGDICIVTERLMDEGTDEENINLIGMFSYDIYDDIMYVERFEAFVDNTMALVVAVLKQAAEVSCIRCVLTVAEADLEDFDFMLSQVEVDISDGKGIMALPVCDDREHCFKLLRNKCFIDEIV